MEWKRLWSNQAVYINDGRSPWMRTICPELLLALDNLYKDVRSHLCCTTYEEGISYMTKRHGNDDSF